MNEDTEEEFKPETPPTKKRWIAMLFCYMHVVELDCLPSTEIAGHYPDSMIRGM